VTEDPRETERLAPAPPVAGGGRGRRLLRRAVVDVGPLRRHRDFRLLWGGLGLSFFGSMVTYVAIPYQVYRLTGSSLVVGLLGLVELVPLLGMALYAGVLLANSLLDSPQVWVLFVVAAAMAGLDGIQRPSLDAMLPRLVDREELPAAGALDALRGTVGGIAGPALGGVLIATVGLPATYGFDCVTFAASLFALSRVRAMPPPLDAEPPSLRRIVEGLRYARSRPELVGTYGVDIVAMFFGMPQALFPAFANEFGGASVLGLLYAAPSLGSLLANATSGWTSHVHRHGLAVIFAAAAWGAAVAVVGLAPSLWIALAFLVVAGAADMVSGIFRMTIWNQTIPDNLRGRLAGIEQVSYSTGPLLGNLESGIAASLVGVRASIVSGGVLCVVGVALAALALPAFVRYDARELEKSSSSTSTTPTD
jgi:MFS family permease